MSPRILLWMDWELRIGGVSIISPPVVFRHLSIANFLKMIGEPMLLSSSRPEAVICGGFCALGA